MLVGRQSWLRARYWWVLELLRDFAARDPDGFHRFLWSHHLAYAETYEVGLRFGPNGLHASRRLLFEELTTSASRVELNVACDVRSVFEVGCSLGYLLRHIEREVCPAAVELEGNDIDGHAIREGRAHLASLGSRVILHHADLSQLEGVFAGRRFDLVLCAGVLMYLREAEAATTVGLIMRHTGRLAVFAGLACRDRDNALLSTAEVRQRDGTFIHNIDRLVTQAGGRVVGRRWDGATELAGNSVYFVFAEPAEPAVT
jgi:SAM-dependent methyltransferase